MLGGARATGEPSSPVLLTVNVTALTHARLLTVLEEAKRVRASFVALQETRHRKAGCPWASRALAGFGWNSLWSEPPPPLHSGCPRQGGTAILWQSSDHCAPFRPPVQTEPLHRVCGVVFREFAVVSLYGPADRPDPPLIASILRHAAELQRPVLVLGDFNWKPAYQPLTAAVGADMFPVIPTVLGSQAAPTRCLGLGEGLCRSAETSANDLAGIPHHKAVCFRVGRELAGSPSPPLPRFRYRRTASYKWSLSYPVSLSDSQLQVLREASQDSQCPRDSLLERFQDWHRRAEAACEAAVNLGLASCERSGERKKGSVPTVRPCTQSPSVRHGEPVTLRCWRRLHRAAAEQTRHFGEGAALTRSQQRHWRAQLGPAGDIPQCQGEALKRASLVVTAEEQAMSRESQLRWRRKFSMANASVLKVAADALRPDCPSNGCARVDSASMTHEWAPRWMATHPDPEAAWGTVLEKSAFSPPPVATFAATCNGEPPWEPITNEEFLAAIQKGKGCAGFDGCYTSCLHDVAL